MRRETRLAFNKLKADLASVYQVENVGEQFTIEPSMAQKLNDKIVQQAEFLQLINFLPVLELQGQTLLGKSKGTITGRTNTEAGTERKPRRNLEMEDSKYLCSATESDTAISFGQLDSWAKFPDLYERYMKYNYEQVANDRELIGWFGTSIAATSNRTANPLLEDVNKGWLQFVREARPENMIVEGVSDSGVIKIGVGGDFENLDDAVYDMKMGIPKYLRQNLVALIGEDLIAKEEGALYKNLGDTPSEKILIAQAKERFGGLPWLIPSNFPDRGLVITSLDNLSIYWQEGSWRRYIRERPELNQIEDYLSRNEGYVVEDCEKFIGLEFENVQILGRDGEWE